MIEEDVILEMYEALVALQDELITVLKNDIKEFEENATFPYGYVRKDKNYPSKEYALQKILENAIVSAKSCIAKERRKS